MSQVGESRSARLLREDPSEVQVLVRRAVETVNEEIQGLSVEELQIPPLLLFHRWNEEHDAFEVLPFEASRFFEDEESKDLLAFAAPELAKKANAELVIFINEAWALRQDAPLAVQKQVAAGELRVADTEYKTTVLNVAIEVDDGSLHLEFFPFDHGERRFSLTPLHSTFDDPPGGIEFRWRFFPDETPAT